MNGVILWRRARYNKNDAHLSEWHIPTDDGLAVCGYWGRGMVRDREDFRSDSLFPGPRVCPKCEEAAS